MGAYNMGWGMRCDGCEGQLYDCIQGGHRKKQIEREARRLGWRLCCGRWLCPVCYGTRAAELPRQYVVCLDDGCWLAEGDGDPPRTMVRENARRFATFRKAVLALQDARKYRPFRRAEVVHGGGYEKKFDQ